MGKYHVCPACGRPESPWISVGDWLPPYGQRVAVWIWGDWIRAYRDKVREDWVWYYPGDQCELERDEVTHWQEIKGP